MGITVLKKTFLNDGLVDPKDGNSRLFKALNKQKRLDLKSNEN